MSAIPTYALRVQDLTIGYGKNRVAENVNMAIPRGSITTIMGINGSGKSTLIRTLAGLQTPLSGQIIYQEKDLAKMDAMERAKKISVVLTDPPASKNLDSQTLVGLGRLPHTNWLGNLNKNDHDKIKVSLQEVGLLDSANTPINELSDGQLQRILIARALAQDSSNILLDEPTSHLDLGQKALVYRLIKKLAKQHQKTILLATHELQWAFQISDHLLILDGKNNPFGTTNHILDSYDLNGLFPEGNIKFDKDKKEFRLNL